MENNKLTIMKVLALRPRDARGDGWASGQELQNATELSPNDINDAVILLKDGGIVELEKQLGTAPFRFHAVTLTARGRGYWEKLQVNSQNEFPRTLQNAPYRLSQTPNDTTEDEKFMRVAIELSKQSTPEDSRPHPKVGAVVVKNGEILDHAFCGEYAQGDHAEYTLLERKLGKMDLTGTTLYTTLEPCTLRGHEKMPCADRIIQRRIGRVVIGMLDPNPNIQGKGLYKLDKAGVRVQLAERLSREIKDINKEFIAAQEGTPTINMAIPQTKIYEDLANILSRLVLRWQSYKDELPNVKWTPEAVEEIKEKFSSDKEDLLNLLSRSPEIDLKVKSQTKTIISQIDGFIFFKISFEIPPQRHEQLQNFEYKAEQAADAAQALHDWLRTEK